MVDHKGINMIFKQKKQDREQRIRWPKAAKLLVGMLMCSNMVFVGTTGWYISKTDQYKTLSYKNNMTLFETITTADIDAADNALKIVWCFKHSRNKQNCKNTVHNLWL